MFQLYNNNKTVKSNDRYDKTLLDDLLVHDFRFKTLKW